MIEVEVEIFESPNEYFWIVFYVSQIVPDLFDLTTVSYPRREDAHRAAERIAKKMGWRLVWE